MVGDSQLQAPRLQRLLDLALAFSRTLHLGLNRSVCSFSNRNRARRWLNTENDRIARLLPEYLQETELHQIRVLFYKPGCVRQISESRRFSPSLFERGQAFLASPNNLREDLLQLTRKHDVADLDAEELQAERGNLLCHDLLKLESRL